MRHQICLALIVKHARASKNFQRKSHMLFENIYLVETVDCKGGKHINWAQFVCGWGAQTWQRVGRVRSLLAETRTHKGLRSYRGWVIPLLIVIQMRSPVWTIHIYTCMSQFMCDTQQGVQWGLEMYKKWSTDGFHKKSISEQQSWDSYLLVDWEVFIFEKYSFCPLQI